MFRLICNLPELNIRIFNPITSYFLFIGMFCGLQVSLADRWLLYFMLPDFSLRSTTCTNPTEHDPCGFQTTIYTNKSKK